MIGSLMDVTDRKRAEEANQRLAHVSRLAVVGELTASIAHEINQPLGAILSNADAADVLLGREPVPVEELRQIVADIRSDDIRAGKVIRQMRALLRRRELAMLPFDLNRAIGDVLGLVGADLGRHGVSVETEFGQLPTVLGDQVHIQQVVLNLILNGVDAMAEAHASQRRLGVRTARADGGGVRVTIWDSGPGIAADHAEQLFDSFFTTKANGMGLGLSIARSIIEAHGGNISAITRREGGASFSFSLPGLGLKAELKPQTASFGTGLP
jgi:two-component system sensor kinase FixL